MFGSTGLYYTRRHCGCAAVRLFSVLLAWYAKLRVLAQKKRRGERCGNCNIVLITLHPKQVAVGSSRGSLARSKEFAASIVDATLWLFAVNEVNTPSTQAKNLRGARSTIGRQICSDGEISECQNIREVSLGSLAFCWGSVH